MQSILKKSPRYESMQMSQRFRVFTRSSTRAFCFTRVSKCQWMRSSLGFLLIVPQGNQVSCSVFHVRRLSVSAYIVSSSSLVWRFNFRSRPFGKSYRELVLRLQR